MTKQEQIQHLANIVLIMDYHERLGTTKNRFLVEEFMVMQQELFTTLEKEHEARKSKSGRDSFDEARARVESGLSGGREPVRGGPVAGYPSNPDVRRPGPQGPYGQRNQP